MPSHSKITHLLDLLRSDAAPPKAVALPTLDQWIESEGMDPEGWSEAELLAEYKAHFGLDNVDAIEAAAEFKDPVGERVRALNYLETVLSIIPTATDRLESWFARPVVKCLRNVGIITLGDLVRFINAYGHRRYSSIKGFGIQRAKQVLHWLMLEQDHLNLQVAGSVHEPKSKQELRVASLLPSVGQDTLAVRQFGAGTLVASAMHRMQNTPALAGGQGDFRSHMANTLGATNYLEAVSSWLARYNEKPATQRSYPANWALSSLPKKLTDDEVAQLVGSLNNPCRAMRRACAIVRCALDLGLRSIEVAQLSLDDIDWHAGTITLRHTKGRRDDILPLPVATGEAIARYLELERPKTVSLLETLTPAQRISVKAVAMDMWPAYMSAAKQCMPQADIVHDKFHVSKYLGEAVDAVRRQEHRKLSQAGTSPLAGSKWAWLRKYPDGRSAEAVSFRALNQLNLKTSRAWCIKERDAELLGADRGVLSIHRRITFEGVTHQLSTNQHHPGV